MSEAVSEAVSVAVSEAVSETKIGVFGACLKFYNRPLCCI